MRLWRRRFAGHEAKDTLLLSAKGKILLEPFPNDFMPVEWDGEDGRELLSRDGKMIGKFDGKTVVSLQGTVPNESAGGRVVMVADLWGDFRDEIVVIGPNAEGNLTVSIFTPTDLIKRRQITRTADHGYRMWLAHNLTGGYGSYFESPGIPQLQCRSLTLIQKWLATDFTDLTNHAASESAKFA